MSTTGLTQRFVFGVTPTLTNNISFIEDSTVTYVAGHNVVIYDMLDRKQKFISGSEKSDAITSIALTPSKKYLSISERLPSYPPSISIYNLRTLRKFKNLTTNLWNVSSTSSAGITSGGVGGSGNGNCEIVSSCFSPDNQVLCTLSGNTSSIGNEDYQLIVWNWNKGKVTTSYNITTDNSKAVLNRCVFSPFDSSIISISGSHGYYKMLRIKDSEVRVISNDAIGNGVNVLSCEWLSVVEDYMVLGTDDGKIVLYEKSRMVGVIEDSPVNTAAGSGGGSGEKSLDELIDYNHDIDDDIDNDNDKDGNAKNKNIRINSLIATPHGFIAGCSNATLKHYVLSSDAAGKDKDTTRMFTCVKTWVVAPRRSRNASVMSIALSPNYEQVCCVLEDNQVFTVNVGVDVGKPYPSFTSVSSVSSSLSENKSKNDGHAHAHDMTPLCTLNHHGGITGLDLCIRKPLLVTSGVDRTVRIWNYFTFKCELIKTFNEDTLSVAFHPSGLHVLVGFADKLRLLNVLMDDIRTYREISIKMCKECRFSNGGSSFAAVNGNVISLFDLYTGDKLGDLRGHNSKVRSVTWSKDDLTVTTCGADGAVYLWNVEKCTRVSEYVNKGTIYNCAIGNDEAVWVVGNDRLLKELEVPDLNVVKELDGGVTIGQIVLSNSSNIMFAATAAENKPGCVRAYSFPLTGEYLEYPCLGGAVTRMRVSCDDMFLFVADEKGTLCVFNVRDKQEKRGLPSNSNSSSSSSNNNKDASSNATAMTWSTEVLVTKSDLEEKHSQMLELSNKVTELTLHNEYQLRLKDMTYSEKIKEVTEKFTADLEHDRNKFELLREEKNDMSLEFDERLKGMQEKHLHGIQELEGTYQVKIMSEVERFQGVNLERDIQRERWEVQQGLLVSTHERYVHELTSDFEVKIDEDKGVRVNLEEEKVEMQKEFDEVKRQVEDDIDVEIQNMRSKYDMQLSAEREATLRFKGENGIMKKKFTVLQKEIEDQKEEIKLLLEKEKELHEQTKALEREIQAHKREIKSRDDTIGEKEKKIYDLKKKNQELEKFKFVLDYKIKELKRQIEPRETEIGDMKAQIKEMDGELELFHKSNAQLDLMIGELRLKLDGMQREILAQRKVIGEQEGAMKRFKSELYDCAQFIQQPKVLEESVAKLYQTHVKKNCVTETEVDLNVQSEYKRHRDFLEKTMAKLKVKFTKDVKAHKDQNVKLMEENISIIQEISRQRESNKITKGLLQQKMGDYKLKMGRMQSSQRKNKMLKSGVSGSSLASASVAMSAGGLERPDTSSASVGVSVEENRRIIAELRAVVKSLEGDILATSEEGRGEFEKGILPSLT